MPRIRSVNADMIFVMERRHRTKSALRFTGHSRNKRVVCLELPDRYRFMDPTLIRLLETKVRPHLMRTA